MPHGGGVIFASYMSSLHSKWDPGEWRGTTQKPLESLVVPRRTPSVPAAVEVAVAHAKVLVSLGSPRPPWYQENLPFNPLALVVAVVAVAETLGTPLWPKEDIPSYPPGHFLPYTIPVGGVSSKASQEMQSL